MRLNPAEIVVVPHTHWDREWYLPFQRFRLRLVSLMDGVVDRMEADPRWRFTLDGQMAAVDDYLEIRPERRERVAALVRDGRLAVGPWQILHDEFLCSGENIVRNLELGMRRADELGAAMMVGYLPDQFGHCAQTPQILRLAGIEHACVWRGVPDRVRTRSFAWEAPDGTAVRTQYLPEGGYGNAASMFEDFGDGASLLPGRAAGFAEAMSPWYPDGGALLAMYGADHTAPAADLADRIGGAGADMRLDTLAGYFAAQDPSSGGLPRVQGELRSHARANILPGVISVRPRLKQLMGRAERLVERYAEPLAALWYTGDAQRFLDLAWRRLIEVSCHDSVTGCGSDETAEQVAARMAEAEQLGRAVCDLVTAERAAAVPLGAHLAFNPTPHARTGLVFLDVPGDGGAGLATGDGRPVPVQVLETAPTVLDDAVHPASALPVLLERVYGRVLFGQEIRDWSVSRDDRTLTFHVTARADTPFDIGDVRAALRDAEGEWRVRILADPRREVAALVDAPPLGLVTVRPGGPDAAPDVPVTADGRVLDNGLLRAEIRDDGTIGLRTSGGGVVEGVGRIMDGGDLGDSYNYAPPAADRLVGDPVSVRVEPVWDGPLVAALDIVRTYRWPASGDVAGDARSAAEEDVSVVTRAELRTGEPFLRLRVTFDNRCADHRVRLHMSLPRQAGSSFAEGQFAVVERGLTAEGGFGERPVPTYPANGFVAAGGLAVLLEHVTEYEVTGGGRELALTLMRSIGYLSRDRNAYRDQPAGPQLPTPGAQSRGERTVGMAIMPYGGERPGHDVTDAAERYRHDLLTATGYGPADAPAPPARDGLSITGPGVAMTSLRPRGDGWIETRLVAQTTEPTTAVLRGTFTEAVRADLRGRPGLPLDVHDGTTTLALRPWEIATVRLRTG
ncbi:glycoside hydrolase family 38 N-terminal domain-containing protein [Actinomadura opuntiae]|uniref:glycoside hydrolase family 38 N-terminal domain-containing protein n=1 Tax=Actinomadura sp. OS1-43 TaxID=604315 RepID=UPI00255AF7B4|nr:glycoside hydrolase family 38 C-terminal domain-containing protein [Actinomadura sp. OS1-43]MDL4817405.1 glycoside hydrolase family 38 C-terminal domain-containing protein [Actinomadura sp. OS1-43]